MHPNLLREGYKQETDSNRIKAVGFLMPSI